MYTQLKKTAIDKVKFFQISLSIEPVPKLIDCALTRTVLGQAFAVFQAFSLTKLRISR
jgi:hypothetical protein